jgi:hypothetical protein
MSQKSRESRLALDAAANGAGYGEKTRAQQNETVRLGDRGHGKGGVQSVFTLSIEKESGSVTARSGVIAL